jgi:hypothetical protein
VHCAVLPPALRHMPPPSLAHCPAVPALCLCYPAVLPHLFAAKQAPHVSPKEEEADHVCPQVVEVLVAKGRGDGRPHPPRPQALNADGCMGVHLRGKGGHTGSSGYVCQGRQGTAASSPLAGSAPGDEKTQVLRWPRQID